MSKVIKRLFSCCFCVLMIVTLCGCGSPAQAQGEADSSSFQDVILFNKIPWGTSYEEAIRIVKDTYDVDFPEPDMDQLEFPTRTKDHKPVRTNDQELEELIQDSLASCKQKGYRNDPFPIEPLTHFSIISSSTVSIAGFDAYILLDFAFANDGKKVQNTDIDSATLDAAEYIFCAENPNNKYGCNRFIQKSLSEVAEVLPNERERIISELTILLQSIYGDSEFGETLSYYVRGKDNSTVKIIDGYDGFYTTIPWYTEIKTEGIDYLHKTHVGIKVAGIYYGGDTTLQAENVSIIERMIENEVALREQEYLSNVKTKDSSGL